MKCNFLKANKELCGNNAMSKDTKCFWHSKKISEDKKNLCRKKGGQSKIIKVKSHFKDFELNSIADIGKLNTSLINSVLQNKLDLRIMTGLIYALNLSLKIIEVESIEKRINKIEDILSKQNTNNNELQT